MPCFPPLFKKTGQSHAWKGNFWLIPWAKNELCSESFLRRVVGRIFLADVELVLGMGSDTWSDLTGDLSNRWAAICPFLNFLYHCEARYLRRVLSFDCIPGGSSIHNTELRAWCCYCCSENRAFESGWPVTAFVKSTTYCTSRHHRD